LVSILYLVVFEKNGNKGIFIFCIIMKPLLK